jgi:hypothetical protein
MLQTTVSIQATAWNILDPVLEILPYKLKMRERKAAGIGVDTVTKVLSA